ncbi:MAG: chromosome segregation protein SMC, partial [Rhizobacter sp.]
VLNGNQRGQWITSRWKSTSIAQKLDSTLLASDAFEIAQQLTQRLRVTRAASQSATLAQSALRTTLSLRDEAQVRLLEAQARPRPLIEAAGVASIAEALPVAERSDRRRTVQNDIKTAADKLIRDGEGLGREAIQAEIAEYEPTQIEALRLKSISDQTAANERYAALLQRRVTAQLAVDAIGGQANAAIAEAKRQEALSAIGDAAEQYVETATASKLLRWAIERYRDRRQGPMLTRAGAVFSELTLGAFTKLVVHSEKEAPTLHAKRSNGQLVEVEGLSDGTRDQLYLALRIAALELRLENAKPLPFIADDLFVNFDDARAKAGLSALRALSSRTQVIFLTHHEHLLPLVRKVFSDAVNVVELHRETASA